jgi:lipopolysaccharide export system protein LptA
VWNPKRVLLLLAGFALFFTGYSLYARYLGGIDGLTPLPEAYFPSENVPGDSPPIPVNLNVADRKLKQAFGEASAELQRTIKLNMPSRGLVLAVDDFKILEQDNSRVLLKPFSIAIFKYPADGSYPEINTVRSEEAIIQLDQPIKTIAEIGSRKIVGGVLYRDIQLVNNRRTPERTDDLSMYTVGPVFFDDSKHLICTDTEVKLVDIKTQPQPTSITARGMDIYLKVESPETQKAAAGKGRAKGGERISDVERIELRSNVRMDLWTDGKSGFLAAGNSSKKPAAPFVGPPAPGEVTQSTKAKILITTNGKFVYDLTTSQARFDIPPRPNPFHPEIVTVIRENEDDPSKHDQLQCDHLELQFVRKPVPGARGRAAAQPDSLEIESAHATGDSLTLASDNEVLDAFGNELFYDAAKKLSILKGKPVVALKEGNEIHARELWIGTTGDNGVQQAIAIGPGEIAMKERTIEGTPEVRTLKARWQDKLIHVKEGNYDLLTLTGNAMFDDAQNGQKLRAERLRVWLEPAAPAQRASAPADSDKRLRPHHIEARGHVTADSPDLHIKEPTENLVIWFKDVPEKPAKVPDGLKPATGTAPTNGGDKTQTALAPAAPPATSTPSNPVIGAPAAPNPQFVGPPPPEPQKQPIELVARSVEVYAVRCGQKTDLERLWCEGDVFVHQEPENPKDQPMEVRGDTMNLNYSAEGGVLLVEGKLAQVQFNKMAIIGPNVNIDQRANTATVNGSGAMRMLSETDFDGNKRTEPTEMVVQWQKQMLFTGMNAEFRGGVQAVQDNGNSRLLCQEMQVVFDRPISLKEGNRGRQPAKVDKLVCHQNVEVEEIRRENGQLLSIRRLVSPAVDMDNADKKLDASGPGEVRIYQLGSADDEWKPGTVVASSAKPTPTAKKPAAPGKQSDASEYKITHVRYQGKMWAKTQEPRKVTFFDNVEAVHGPATQPDMVIDVDKLPQGWMYIQCGRLDVLTRRLTGGRASQEMIAQHKVQVQAQEFWGNADVLKYEEAYDRVIFEGRDSPAVLYRVTAPGAPPQRLTGMKIFYYRKTNTFDVEKSTGLSTN